MNYTLHQLQVFLKVVQTRSVTKAARELHLSQPAVSIQVKNLQEQFEIPLMEVLGRKIFITEFGKEIAAAAEKILEEINSINSMAAAYRGQLIGRMTITVVSTGKYVMPSFLSRFMKLYPGIELSLDVTNRTRVIKALERNEVDFALVSFLPENLQVEEIKLMENELFLVGSRQHIEGEEATVDIFNRIPLIFREEGSGTRNLMEKFIKSHNLTVNKKMELTSNEAVKQAVIADLGFSILAGIGIRSELITGDLRIINVKGFPIRSTWRLIWLKNKRLSPVAQAYKDYLQNEKKKIIKEKFKIVT